MAVESFARGYARGDFIHLCRVVGGAALPRAWRDRKHRGDALSYLIRNSSSVLCNTGVWAARRCHARDRIAGTRRRRTLPHFNCCHLIWPTVMHRGVGGAALPRARQDRKDKEKEKRGKGQSSVSHWKSEAEMVLRCVCSRPHLPPPISLCRWMSRQVSRQMVLRNICCC